MNDITKEPLNEPDRFDGRPGGFQSGLSDACDRIRSNVDSFGMGFPASSSEDGVYERTENTGWTPGFWTGQLWLAYEWTGERVFSDTANRSVDTFLERLEDRRGLKTHDLGFLYVPSCLAAYLVAGREDARDAVRTAATLLADRFREEPGIIQAWGDLDDPNDDGWGRWAEGRMIVDTMMNIPLLFRATALGGESRFHDIAVSHAEQTAEHLVRKDGSTFHTYAMDVESGRPIGGETHQGYADNSCWARGQAWAIYGFSLCHRYTGDVRWLDVAECVANYYLNRLPTDLVPYWDLTFTDGPEERDSSAAAVAASGLLELADQRRRAGRRPTVYDDAARSIISSLLDGYAASNDRTATGLLLHGVYGKPTNMGIDECCLWGDYFYVEALVRSLLEWESYW